MKVLWVVNVRLHFVRVGIHFLFSNWCIEGRNEGYVFESQCDLDVESKSRWLWATNEEVWWCGVRMLSFLKNCVCTCYCNVDRRDRCFWGWGWMGSLMNCWGISCGINSNKSCWSWSSVIKLGTSALLHDSEERIGVTSVCEEGEREGSSGVGGDFDWKMLEKNQWESAQSRGLSTSELLKKEMVLKTVWFESFESRRGELEEKLGMGESEIGWGNVKGSLKLEESERAWGKGK